MNTELLQKKCGPCSRKTERLKSQAVLEFQRQLGDGWKVIDEHHLEKEYAFRNFKEALGFANRVGAVAEEEMHHPDILVAWGRVKLTIWTHAIDGLSENDFILAAKAELQTLSAEQAEA